jgi:hypothetical protein
VAVGAEEDEVLEAVVVAVAVGVVEGEGQRPPTPAGDSALLAPILLQPSRQDAELDVVPVPWRVCGEEFVER